MGTVESGWASSASAPFSTMRSVVMKRRSAAPRKSGSKKRVGAEHLPVAGGVGPVGVDDGGIEVEGGHGHQLDVGVGRVGEVRVPGAVGGAHQAQVGVDGEDVGAEAGPGGQEGDPPGRRLQAEEEHALVDLHHLDLAVLAGGPPVRIERDGVEGDEAAHHLAHLAGGAEQPDVGAAVGDDGEVVRSERQMARTTAMGLRREPQPPMPIVMPERSSPTMSSTVVRLSAIGSPSVPRHCDVSASRFSTKAARCSSATPRTCSS